MSKALERFWHWAIGEKPSAVMFETKVEEQLDEVEAFTVIDAATYVTQHGRGRDFETNLEDYEWCLEHQPEAFRDLSLAFHAALERMREAVPRAEPIAAITDEEFATRNDPGPEWWKCDTADAAAYALTGISEMHATGRRARNSRIHDLRAMFTSEPFFAARAMPALGPAPTATPEADGSHMHDRLCMCGAFILKAGGAHSDGYRLHQEHTCY